MKKFFKLTALMLALVLALSINAFAAESYTTRSWQVFNSGKALEADVKFSLDEESVLKLAGAGVPPEQADMVKGMFGPLFSIVNKLRIHALFNGNNMQLDLGTESGPILDYAVRFGDDSKHIKLHTSLLDNIVFQVDLEKMMSQLPGETFPAMPAFPKAPEGAKVLGTKEAMKLLAEAFSQSVIAVLKDSAKVEEGSFDVSGVGSFNKKISVEVTEKHMYDILDSFLKGDFAKSFGMSNWDISSLKGKAEEGKDVLPVTVYQNDAESYLVLNMLKKDNFGSFAVLFNKKEYTARGTLLTKPLTEEEYNTIANRALDELAKSFYQAAVEKTEKSASIVNFGFALQESAAEEGITGKAQLLVDGNDISVEFAAKESKAEKYQGELSYKVFLDSSKPLFTLNVSMQESDKVPGSQFDAGKKEVSLTDLDEKALTEQLGDPQQILTKLMERLQTALPEVLPYLQMFMGA